MISFIKSLIPVLQEMKDRLKGYIFEMIFIIVAVTLTVISAVIYFKTDKNNYSSNEISGVISPARQMPQKIYIDISGSVEKPGLYEALYGIRLKQAIVLAGGLTDTADTDFFNRSFNLARIVKDQEKIYVPSVREVATGYDINSRTGTAANGNKLININIGGKNELDGLPGIGEVTVQKIIDGRPFEALEELIDRKIVNKTTYENIKDLITL